MANRRPGRFFVHLHHPSGRLSLSLLWEERRLQFELTPGAAPIESALGPDDEGPTEGGAVILWDRGAVHDHSELSNPDEIELSLSGFRLSGRVKLSRAEEHWAIDPPLPEDAAAKTSILSGLSAEALATAPDAPKEAADQELAELPKASLQLSSLRPMLAETAPGPFSRDGWIFELKYDGYRLLSGKRGSQVDLRFRSGNSSGAAFPELSAALSHLPYDSLTLDGEVIVLNEAAHPDFKRLQQRAQLSRPEDLARAVIERPVIYAIFDLLSLQGRDLRALPLTERKRWLRRVLPAEGPLRYVDHIEVRGEALFEQIRQRELEGVMAKRAAARYQHQRSGDWLKVRVEHSDEFVIIGYTAPEGSRVGLGSLYVASFEGERLIYRGRVGTGYDTALLKELAARLAPLVIEKPAAEGVKQKTGRKSFWVKPELVCEVKYSSLSEDQILRFPVFLRLRDDKPISELKPPPEGAPRRPKMVESKTARETNRDKIYFPKSQITKGQIIDYYRAIFSRMGPYLRDRLVVMDRYAEGIEGPRFYQKSAPRHTPSWIPKKRMFSPSSGRNIDYLLCDHVEALAFLVNLGSIPVHMWQSRAAQPERPDWCVLDLDPKAVPFAQVIELAKKIKALTDAIGLELFVKTSGKTGLHLMTPLGQAYDYDQSQLLSQLLAKLIVQKHPELATVDHRPDRRGDRIFIDTAANRRGQLLVAPYSVRPIEGAPISMPLSWAALEGPLGPQDFTIETALQIPADAPDPLAGVLGPGPDLQAVLTKLAPLLSG